jgi:hypothetical protein
MTSDNGKNPKVLCPIHGLQESNDDCACVECRMEAEMAELEALYSSAERWAENSSVRWDGR